MAQDDRVRRQIEQYLGELGMDDLRFATFRYVKEFTELYFRDRTNDPPPEAPAEGEDAKDGAELKLFSEVNMIIFALDTIGEKSGSWIDKLKADLVRFKYWPENGRTRMVMLKFEEDGVGKLDVLHPNLDDLIYLPIDRLVFLQKVQILINLPRRVSAKFLFNQEFKYPIEISKITKIDRLSDVGLAIRNPVPLQKGLPGHFYLNLPGEKTRLEVHAKVIRSVPHPDYPGQHLVYFTYFGLPKAALTLIRRLLAKAPRYQSLLTDDREKFRENLPTFFGDNDVASFSAVVLDPDEGSARNVAQAIAKDMTGVQAVHETSFQHFFNHYFDSKDAADKVPPKPTTAADFFHTPIELSISVDDLKCFSVNPGPNEPDKFLGHSAMMIFGDHEKWLTLIEDKSSRLVIQEAAQLANRGHGVEKLLNMRDADGAMRALLMKFSQGATENFVTVTINPASDSDILSRTSLQKTEGRLDALIVDTKFTPEDIAPWMEGIRQRAAQQELTKKPEDLKFFFISDTESTPSAHWLNARDALTLINKPVDLRQLMFLISETLPNKNTIYTFDNLGWSSPGLSVHVAKDVELEALSEYGATLKSQQRIAPGTMIYLRKSIFDNAPNQCLAARVYACEDHPNDKGFHVVYATYFGINDAFLKFARTWIRENYAHQKKKE